MNRRSFLRSSLAAALLPAQYVDPDPDPARREWFKAQQNQRHGACCGEEQLPGDTNFQHDGHPLRTDECRQVIPFWDGDADSEARFRADPSYEGTDLTVQWQVRITDPVTKQANWWNVHNWQLTDKKKMRDYWKYITGAAEVWYRWAWNQKNQRREPNIFCFLPPPVV